MHNNMFVGTPLEQDTLALVECRSEADWDWAYTPEAITSWGYDRVDSPHYPVIIRNMYVHEMCHIIDIFRRNKKRLLKNNFGFKDTAITLAGAKTEAWVAALHDMMIRDLFNERLAMENFEETLTVFSERGCDVDRRKWKRILAKMQREHRAVGLESYYQSWHDAVEYIKTNRKIA